MIMYHTIPLFLPMLSQINEEGTKNHTQSLRSLRVSEILSPPKHDPEEDEIVPAASTV